MTGNIRSIRPARAAIAAVLAFSSPALLAQTVVVPPAVSAETPAAQTTAPSPAPAEVTTATPQFAPTQPVVQSTPSVEERLNAAIAASQAEAESAAPAPGKRSASRPAAQSMSRKAPAPRAATDPAPVAAPATERATQAAPTAPVAPPVEVAPVSEATAPVAAQEAPAQSASIDPALLWAMGGGALLLVGLGGAALLRSRRKRDQWVDADDRAPVEPVRAAPAPMPLMTPTPAVMTQSPTPATGSASTSANTPLSAEQGMLEAMVAAPPSPENPFRTHAKRVTRAKFLLAQQQAAHRTPATGAPRATGQDAPAHAESPRPAPAAAQTVYRFGADRRRDSLLKPRTS